MRLDRLETDVTFIPVVAIDQTRGTVISVSYFDRNYVRQKRGKMELKYVKL